MMSAKILKRLDNLCAILETIDDISMARPGQAANLRAWSTRVANVLDNGGIEVQGIDDRAENGEIRIKIDRGGTDDVVDILAKDFGVDPADLSGSSGLTVGGFNISLSGNEIVLSVVGGIRRGLGPGGGPGLRGNLATCITR